MCPRDPSTAPASGSFSPPNRAEGPSVPRLPRLPVSSILSAGTRTHSFSPPSGGPVAAVGGSHNGVFCLEAPGELLGRRDAGRAGAQGVPEARGLTPATQSSPCGLRKAASGRGPQTRTARRGLAGEGSLTLQRSGEKAGARRGARPCRRPGTSARGRGPSSGWIVSLLPSY